MAFTFSWTDKQTGDYILASDINSLADGIEETQAEFSKYITRADAVSTFVPKQVSSTETLEVGSTGGKFFIGAVRGGTIEIYSDNGTLNITGVTYPTSDTDAATKKYVDDTVPTKASQLENDEKYIKNTGTDIDEERRVVKIGDSGLYNLVLEAYQVRINSESSGYVAIMNLQDPTSDRDAANKQYVDSAIAAAITTALNTAV